MNNIQVPSSFSESREALMRKKVEEAKSKLDAFLEENDIFVGATLKYTPTGLLPDIIVLPKQFLKNNKENGEVGKIDSEGSPKEDSAIIK